MNSYSFIRTHHRLLDAMQSGEADYAYALCRLLCVIAVSDKSVEFLLKSVEFIGQSVEFIGQSVEIG